MVRIKRSSRGMERQSGVNKESRERMLVLKGDGERSETWSMDSKWRRNGEAGAFKFSDRMGPVFQLTEYFLVLMATWTNFGRVLVHVRHSWNDLTMVRAIEIECPRNSNEICADEEFISNVKACSAELVNVHNS